MTPLAIATLALALSIDAFVAALGRGAQSARPGLAAALSTGAVFGAVEALTPLLGWAAGLAAAGFVTAIDHWIAFVLLTLVGARMVLHALAKSTRPATTGGLVITALGSSIDAFAVGISLAVLGAPILVVALCIGMTTLAMATLGTLAGASLGRRFGRWAEVAGGVALIALGTGILVEHTLLA
ncbi:manganese efflux pump MntP family protein [Vannielia litorea]|uniref:Putative manganese efflux pump MntP n=1 Tax=Vannielia litorea TaxID=1217970 RepID=A0A1N6III3_9RHOB|nr:manganese efflux pump MntP family protein [Vannielia litorea]SIO31832.1 Putative Mn2+ efflux pump MntP [Vannielia litorea]